jgi:uncharacterized iron-regulated membrane protein/flavodoxin
MKLLHRIIFWTHLLSGVVAGVVIFIMSFTGVILMYEPQIAEYSEWNQRWVIPPGPEAKRLPLEDLVAKARAANPDARPATITVKSDPAAAIIVNVGRGDTVFINPYTGELLGGLSATHHFMHDIVQWHRWLGMEGNGRDTGKAITGACNLAFFWLALTGVYLWWPQSWKWRGLKTSLLINVRLTGKARDWNWHNVIGFWSSSVLVVLTLTAAVMSYPWANDLLYTVTGSEPPPRAREPAGPIRRTGRSLVSAEAKTPAKPIASFDALLATAEKQVPGWTMLTMRFSPRPDAPVAVTIMEPSAPHPFARSQLTLNRTSAEVVKWEPYLKNNLGRKLRTWFRGLHTGEALGFFGQTAAGVASLGGCFLVWTGLAMAWRRFRYRNRDADVALTVEYITAPVEGTPAIIEPEPQIIENSKERVRIEVEQINSSATNGRVRNGQEEVRVEWHNAPSNCDSVLILYGTVTGNAESLAHRLAAALRQASIPVQVRDMAHCQPNMITLADCVLFVTSTYGDGEPPDDAAPFWEAVVHGSRLDLHGVKFSVLALGNTTYDHFCKCGRELDSALERHGATRLYPRVDCDVDFEVPARFWMDGVLAILRQEHNLSAPA